MFEQKSAKDYLNNSLQSIQQSAEVAQKIELSSAVLKMIELGCTTLSSARAALSERKFDVADVTQWLSIRDLPKVLWSGIYRGYPTLRTKVLNVEQEVEDALSDGLYQLAGKQVRPQIPFCDRSPSSMLKNAKEQRERMSQLISMVGPEVLDIGFWRQVIKLGVRNNGDFAERLDSRKIPADVVKRWVSQSIIDNRFHHAVYQGYPEHRSVLEPLIIERAIAQIHTNFGAQTVASTQAAAHVARQKEKELLLLDTKMNVIGSELKPIPAPERLIARELELSSTIITASELAEVAIPAGIVGLKMLEEALIKAGVGKFKEIGTLIETGDLQEDTFKIAIEQGALDVNRLVCVYMRDVLSKSKLGFLLTKRS